MAAYNGNGSTEYHEIMEENAQLKSKIKSLESEITLLEEERESLKGKIESLEAESESLQLLESRVEDQSKRIHELEDEIKKLKEVLKNYEKDLDRLYLSQLAFLFEQAVCSYVLPDVFEGNNFATIKKLLGCLNGGKKLPVKFKKAREAKILSDGRRRWEEVCDNLQFDAEWKAKAADWDFDDYDVPQILQAIGYLKEDRITVAHPSPIKLSVAKEKVLSDSIKDQYQPRWQYEPIKEFICSMPEYLKKGNLHHDKIDFN